MAPRQPYSAFATTVPGLGPILAAEADAFGLRAAGVGNDGRADVVTFSEADWLSAGRLRTAESIFMCVIEVPLRSTARSTAAQVEVADIAAAVQGVRTIDARTPRRVRLVVRLREERRFTRSALRSALARQLRPVVTTEETAAELWVLQTTAHRLQIGLRIATLGTKARHPRPVERPGALRPAVAAGMVRLVEQRAAMLDPCCGTGTVAIEATVAGLMAFAGDLDTSAVDAARANGVAAVMRLDARRLPVARDSVDAVVTNLPFGRQYPVQGAPVAWYRRVLSEALRVAPQLVVLAAPTQPFRQALGRLDVRLGPRHDLQLLGNRTAIWVIHRRG